MAANAMAITSGGCGGNYLLPPKSFLTRPASFPLSANPPNSIRFIPRISVNNSSAVGPNKKKNPPPIVVSSSTDDHEQRWPRKKRATEWTVDSWKTKDAYDNLPPYPDKEELESVLKTLEKFPPLVFGGEARKLEERLAEAARGKAFLLQGGYCAESFKGFNAYNIMDTFTLLLHMANVLMFCRGGGEQLQIIKVGRMAGQFARLNCGDPFSGPFSNSGALYETRMERSEEPRRVRLPSYRGDNVNGPEFDIKSRTPDPQRLIKAYSQSAATLNLLRAFATGGYAALHKIADWGLNFTNPDDLHQHRYRELASRMDEAMGFMSAAGVTMDHHPIMTTTDFWTSHECLHLPYEQSLTRMDYISGLYYDCSAHMLWVGERTRQLDGAHVEFLRGVANPIGIKVSQFIECRELVKLIKILNPQNKPGRITLITRMGVQPMLNYLPDLIRAVRSSGQIVTWVTDPMHANIERIPPVASKTGCFDYVLLEMNAFFDVHEQEGSHPGGVHLEITSEDVYECIDGFKETHLVDRLIKTTDVDPRLNASQSLKVAFMVADRLKNRKMSLAE